MAHTQNQRIHMQIHGNVPLTHMMRNHMMTGDAAACSSSPSSPVAAVGWISCMSAVCLCVLICLLFLYLMDENLFLISLHALDLHVFFVFF